MSKYIILLISSYLLIILFLFLGSRIYLYEAVGSEKRSITLLKKNKINYSEKTTETAYGSLRSLHIGEQSKPKLVMIHGAPGGLNTFLAYSLEKELLEIFQLIVVERLGYGASVLNDNHKSLSISQHTDAIGSLIQHMNDVSLAGYSFGGPIAATLASRHPENINKMIAMAGAFDEKKQSSNMITHISLWKIWKWAIAPEARTGLYEKLALSESLREVAHEWSKIKVPTQILHYDRDWLVPVENSRYLYEAIASEEKKIILLSGYSHNRYRKKPHEFVRFLYPTDTNAGTS